MTGSLLAALLLVAQPAPEETTEDPVAVEAEADAQTQIQAPTPPNPAPPASSPAHANGSGNGHAAQPAAGAEAEAEAAPQEEEICRRRLVPSTRIGQRHRVTTVCKTREEWARGNRR